MKKFTCVVAVAAILSSCAPRSETIKASYVSPLQYQDYTCKQIRGEMSRVSRKVNEISGVQDSQASKDSVALGVGLILFWPALFFMIGDDQKEELSRLKGEYDALEQVAIQKNCDVAREIEEARKMAADRRAAQEHKQKETGKTNQ